MKVSELSISDLVALKSELNEYIKFYEKEFFMKIAEDVKLKLTAVEKEINRRVNQIDFN